MSQTTNKAGPSILKIAIKGDKIKAEISDGRIVLVPLAWFPRLLKASMAQLQNFAISPYGYGVHWPELDEDVSIRSFLS